MLILESIAVIFSIIVLIVVLVMCICIVCNIDIAEWIKNFKTRNDYLNDSHDSFYSFRQFYDDRIESRKLKKRCKLCGTTIDLLNDTTYCDQLNKNYLHPISKTGLCINCQYVIYKNGLITVPYSKSIGNYFNNDWACYGRKFKNEYGEFEQDFWKLSVKMDRMTNWIHIDKFYIENFKNNNTKYKNETNIFYFQSKFEDDVENLIDDEIYDKFVDIYKESDIDIMKLVKYNELRNLLIQFFGNEPECYKCKNKIFTPRMYQIMLNKLEQDDKIDDVTKYSLIYKFEKLNKNRVENVNYFIDKLTNKIKPYCGECVKKSIGKNKLSSSIYPLEPVVFYDSIEQIKSML